LLSLIRTTPTKSNLRNSSIQYTYTPPAISSREPAHNVAYPSTAYDTRHHLFGIAPPVFRSLRSSRSLTNPSRPGSTGGSTWAADPEEVPPTIWDNNPLVVDDFREDDDPTTRKYYEEDGTQNPTYDDDSTDSTGMMTNTTFFVLYGLSDSFISVAFTGLIYERMSMESSRTKSGGD